MKNKTSKINVKLSKDINPISYDIQLRPDLENFTFEGMEIITLLISKDTRILTMHSKELEIMTAQIEGKNKKDKIFAQKISYDTKKETVSFVFKEKIPKGKKKLTLVFKGILNDKMRGFYKSTYQIDGKIHNMATTQFEATDARRAFPCFDEPAQKAVFHVSLVVPKGKTAISNTLPIAVSEHDDTFQVIKFAPTPKMSTYLLAFIVGDFEHLEKTTKNGVKVRVFTTPGKVHQAEFALEVTVKVLEFYEKYFNIKYPLNTLDTIAIPDFTSGAMENWGAITYRESALLIDPEHSSTSTKQWVALVIAHELAHQWFGNLVTMEWWTHLWLNEGFASYIEYLAVDELFPEWDIWTQFATNDTGIALRLDGLKNTHPVEVVVHHPDEIGEIFDAISYSKGASIIRMLADYLGHDKFRDGLRYYLKKHSYKNTETIHLWEAFEKVSKKKVTKIMRNWTGKSGYPVVKVDINKDKLTFAQDRFFLNPNAKREKGVLWDIPITLGNDIYKEKILFSKKQDSIPLPSSWVKINLGESSFFRTAYSSALLERLVGPVAKKDLPAIDRLGIVRDLFALSESGVISTVLVLEFLKAYKNEDDYNVWIEIAIGLAHLEQLLYKTSSKEKLDKFLIDLFSPLLDNLTWEKKEGERHTDTLLRSLAISRLGRSGSKEVIHKAKHLCKMIQQGEHINPDIRGAIYSIVATVGGTKEYEAFIKQYKNESLHEEKNRIGNALGYFKDKEILCKVVHFALSSDVRTQDTISMLSSIGANPNGRDVWLTSLKINWNTFLSRYGDGGHALGRLVKAISASPEEKHLKRFNEFWKTHDAPGATRAIEQVKEQMESNITWLKRDKKNIDKFFSKD